MMNALYKKMRCIIACAALSGAVATAFCQRPYIDVVYPRPRELDGKVVIASVDSNFIFGSVQPPEAKLTINKSPVALHPNGAFLSFLPVTKKSQSYNLHAECNGSVCDTIITFLFPNQLPPDTTKPPQFNCPVAIRFLSGNNVTRTSVQGAYDLFPLEGTLCIAKAQKDNFLQIKLTSSRSTWVESRFVVALPDTTNPSIKSVYKIICRSEDNWTAIQIPDIGRPLFRLEDLLDPVEIRLTLYGVNSNLDIVQLQHDDPILDRISWEQLEDSVMILHMFLKYPSWGYRARWNANALEIMVKHPPDLSDGLKGITVAIDPGHGGTQFGAIGPTRLNEKDLNLAVATQLYTRLVNEGAQAILIRTDDETVDLYERIDRAKNADADLLISIHHNAFPDGVNPFLKPCGTGTYYYRPQSIDAARLVHESLLKATDLPDDGLFYDNLALVRPTDFPAILVEIAYLILPEQEMQLKKPSVQKRCANALYYGIKSFVKERRKGN